MDFLIETICASRLNNEKHWYWEAIFASSFSSMLTHLSKLFLLSFHNMFKTKSKKFSLDFCDQLLCWSSSMKMFCWRRFFLPNKLNQMWKWIISEKKNVFNCLIFSEKKKLLFEREIIKEEFHFNENLN